MPRRPPGRFKTVRMEECRRGGKRARAPFPHRHEGSKAMKLDPLHARSRSAAASGARLSVIGLAALFACTTSDAVRAATPASCESLTNFRHPDTTINSAQSQAGGAYVAPDAWHLAFTDLPPYCEVQATLDAYAGFEHQGARLDADAALQRALSRHRQWRLRGRLLLQRACRRHQPRLCDRQYRHGHRAGRRRQRATRSSDIPRSGRISAGAPRI